MRIVIIGNSATAVGAVEALRKYDQSADVTVLGVSLQNASLGIDDPFSKLSDNQDLLGAFGDEKSCSEIVTVYGG